MANSASFPSFMFSPHFHHYDHSPFELASLQFERTLPARIAEIKACPTNALQQEKIGKLFADVIDSGMLQKIAFLIDELPPHALSSFFEAHGQKIFPHVDDAEKSVWLYCIEGAIQKKKPELLTTLLSLFEKLAKENDETNLPLFEENSLAAIKMLASDSIDLALQFLLTLPESILKNVLLALPLDLTRAFFAAQPQKLLDTCLEARFSFFIDLLVSHINDEAIFKGYCQASATYLTQGNHDALWSLLKPLCEKQRRELFASFPPALWQQLIEKPGESFFHFFAMQFDVSAWQMAACALEILPFDTWTLFMQKKDAAGLVVDQYLANPNLSFFAEAAQKKIQAALNLSRTQNSLSLKRLRSFLTYNLNQKQREQLYTLLPLVKNHEIESVRNHFDELRGILQKNGIKVWSRFVILNFATCLVEGPQSLPQIKFLRKALIRDYKLAMEGKFPRGDILEKATLFKKQLDALIETMIETSLASLDGKVLSLDDIRPYLAQKLTKNSFLRLVSLARASPNASIQAQMQNFYTSALALEKLNVLMRDAKNRAVTGAEIEKIIPFLPQIDDAEVLAFLNLLEKSTDIEIVHLVARFKTLLLARELEVPPPAHVDLLREAYYIEKTVVKIVSTQDEIFRRRDTKLPHTLQINPKTGMICILPPPSRARWRDQGSYKIATNGWSVMKEGRETLFPIVRLVSRLPTPKQDASFPTLFGHLRAEIEIMKHFGAGKNIHPCFNPIFSCAEYPIRRAAQPGVPSKEFSRMSIIVAPAWCNLHQYVNTTKDVPLIADQIRFMKESLSALVALHAEGIIHGDIKPGNIVLVRDSNNILHAKIIDFGFAVASEKNLPLNILHSGSRYNEGYYGSIRYTAPELLGRKNFTGDHYKVDAYALGYTMFELYHRGHPSWGALSEEMFHNQNAADFVAERKKIVLAQLDKFVSSVLAPFSSPQNVPSSPEWIYQYTMAMLLHPDPAKRWSPGQALQELDRVQL